MAFSPPAPEQRWFLATQIGFAAFFKSPWQGKDTLCYSPHILSPLLNQVECYLIKGDM